MDTSDFFEYWTWAFVTDDNFGGLLDELLANG
jgi:hypothetical protein